MYHVGTSVKLNIMKSHDVQEVSRLVGDFMDPKGAHAQGWQMMNRDNDEVRYIATGPLNYLKKKFWLGKLTCPC